MHPRLHIHGAYALTGLALGFSLSFIGFADYGEVRRMFTFQDLRLVWVFAGAVGLSALGFFALKGRTLLPPRPIHRGTIVGGLLFGVGWALSGACPAIALVQLGEGKLLAVFSLAGILAGTWVSGWMQARFFRWDSGSCED